MTTKFQMYHNTKLMLKHYRDISWVLECFPSDVAAELDRPLGDLDALISLINSELGMNNVKLESRLQSVQKSRLLLDRFAEIINLSKVP